MDNDAFQRLFDELRSTTGWAADDRRGGLNNITPRLVAAAAAEVRLGRHVSLAAPIEQERAVDNHEPVRHEMTHPPGGRIDSRGLHFAKDRLVLDVHGEVDSHLDALCHVIYEGRLYNGVSAATLGAGGPTELSIDIAHNGIVGRGVLLDIPRLRSVDWLEPGDHVMLDDLIEAEKAQNVRVEPGDLLFVRVGHRRRRNELGPWNASEARSGLHPEAARFLAERRVAALGSDGNNDSAPSPCPGVAFPIHVLAMVALGLHLMDFLQFEELAEVCAEAGRWSFLCVAAPLRLPNATGSPVNPIAIL